ncbi:MAG: hypothetical protein ACI9YE_000753 [Psychroserpens sp.]|jgi:hypothetical protein
MATKNNIKAQQAVTTRFTLGDYMNLLAEVERTGSNPSQMLRKAWHVYMEQQSIEVRLAQLESRLTRRTFEIVSAVAGLSETEKKEALQQAKLALKEVA